MQLSSLMGGPPYALNNAQIGGIPSVPVDVPPLAVFLALHATAAIISIPLAESHRRRGHSCVIPIITFLFSGERVLACAVRIAWAFRPTNVRVAVASQVLLQAGVLLLLLLNLILAERLWLDRRPGRRTRRGLKVFLGAVSAMTVSALIMVVVSIVVSVYTLDQRTIEKCREVQRTAACYLVVLAVAPVALLLLAALFPAVPMPRGTRLNRSKLAIVLLSCLLYTINTGFKAGVLWARPKSLFDPAWYHSRACLYTFVLGTELLALVLLSAVRADIRFESSMPWRNEAEQERHMEAVEGDKRDSIHSADICTQRDVQRDGPNCSAET